jgi:hypothetical protein
LSGNSQAVFIGYASQDAEAVGRICEALRAAGIEVWNGLRWGSIVLFAVFLAAETGSSAEPSAPPEQTDFLAANLDSSVSPGNDFFQYANGGWLKRNPIQPAESTWSIAS